MKSPLPLHQRNNRVSPCETLTPPPPSSHGRHRSPRSAKENVDPNPAVQSPLGKTSPSKLKPGLPPRPPNPLKRKLNLETLPENDVLPSLATDYGVQVIVRMRPLNNDGVEGDQIVQKISSESISILDHAFTFDSIADTKSTQQDIFNLVGVPLVENCLAGFNSSIFAYGQTGSGKTYTMWGPPSALSEDNSGSERGLTPRVFERLFFRINEVGSTVPSDKQLTYRCRCSFWEIYNEQITDLLNPVQKNLQIREDVKAGVYVDYLTEVFVCTTKDVTQLLIKGLANRKTSATTVNAESSRSHCVFTCVVESRSKSVPDGLSSIRTSRINLVDLAGSERQKLTGAAGERLREAGNINRSLSQLGNLINILAEVSQSGKQRHIPYRDSKLTFLLQESLGGNAKLAMICAISPSQSCKNETLSTLRFAQRAKAIKNKATINEIRQDDVNVLREQIRQLKDELLRMKSNGSSVESNGSYSTGWNARRSLSLLRMSLNCPTVVPVTKDDSDVEMEIDENDVERSHIHANPKSSSHEELPVQPGNYMEEDKTVYYNKTISGIGHSIGRSQSDNGSNDRSSDIVKCRDLEEIAPSQVCSKNDAEICSSMDHSINKSLDNGPVVHVTNENVLLMPNSNKVTDGKSLEEKVYVSHGSTLGTNSADMSNADPSNNSSGCVSSIMSQVCLDNMPCQTSPDLNSPTLSVSPIVESQGGKDLRTSSAMPSSQNSKLTNSDLLVLSLSFAENSSSNPSKAPLIQKQKDCTAPNDRLAASLHHGLQIIDNLQQNSALRMSAFRFSMRPTDLKPLMPLTKVDVGVQTLQESETEVSTSLCRFCKNKASESEHQDVDNSKDLQLVTADETLSMDNATKQLPKAVEKVLAGAIRREMALEYRCRKQDAEIVQLGRLVHQYKHERECNAIIVQTCEDKIARLESLMDDILPTEEFMDAEFISLTNEHKILKGKYENHPEILRVNIELKRALDELDGYRNFFDLGERDVLMEEIQDLRTQLQYYTNSLLATRKLSQVHRFTPANQLVANPVSTIAELAEESTDKKLEKERSHTGNDSKLISLIEELRLELEASRCLAEKQKLELDTEKKCAEELKEALQIAMQGHARILEQYADLQEKNIELLRRHRKISDGIEDVKRAAVKAGVKGPESRFINSLSAEISALRVEREKERRYWTDENKGLRAQLRDTAEAVQAAGELLVRLKEAEEALALAQKRALVAEDETEKAYQEIDRLKENYDREIITLNKLVEEAHLPNDTRPPAPYGSEVEFDLGEDGEFSKGTDPSLWYSGYDRCNM